MCYIDNINQKKKEYYNDEEAQVTKKDLIGLGIFFCKGTNSIKNLKILKNKNKSNEINIKSNTPREINKKNNNNAIKEINQKTHREDKEETKVDANKKNENENKDNNPIDIIDNKNSNEYNLVELSISQKNIEQIDNEDVKHSLSIDGDNNVVKKLKINKMNNILNNSDEEKSQSNKLKKNFFKEENS